MSAPALDTPVATTITGEVTAVAQPASSVPAPGARIAALVALLAVLVGALASPGGPLVARAGYATLLGGPLEVDEGAGWLPVAVGETVATGRALRASGGRVVLDTAGARLVLAAGTRARVVDGRLAIDRGSVLIDGDELRTVGVDGVEASGSGTWRVDAGPRPRVATYRGAVEVADGSTTVPLGAFRQVVVRDRAVGGAVPVPLRYVATDPFDREQLGEAFRVDDLAQALRSALTNTYGDTPRGAAFSAVFAPDSGTAELLSAAARGAGGEVFGRPAEVLLGLVVVDTVLDLRDTSGVEAAQQVVTLWEHGATWGLIVVAAGGDADAFSRAADRVLQRAAADPTSSTDPVAGVAVGVDPGGGSPPVAGDGGTATSGGGRAGDPVPPSSAGDGDTGGGGSGGQDAPAPTDPLPPVPDREEGTDLVEDSVTELGDALADAVGGATGGPGG